MGRSFSSPIKPNPQLGVVGIGLESGNAVRLFHAPVEVEKMVADIVHSINIAAGKSGDDAVSSDMGTTCYRVPRMFCSHCGTVEGLLGKLFTIRLLEGMLKLGYEHMVSGDFARDCDDTLHLFRQSNNIPQDVSIVCVAPGSINNVTVLHGDDSFLEAVKESFTVSYTKGIKKVRKKTICEETPVKITLHGRPWVEECSTADSMAARFAMVTLVGKLASLKYRLLCGVNIKGATDSFFFIHDPTYMHSDEDFCMISLNNLDRIRMVQCADLATSMRNDILSCGYAIKTEGWKHDSWEFQLVGTPWWCSGKKAVRVRRMISRVSETMLQNGWALMHSLDISRTVDDKAVFLYRSAKPSSAIFACIALSAVNHIRLLDLPLVVRRSIQDAIQQHYEPGVRKIVKTAGDGVSIRLKGSPWNCGSCHNLHGRNAIIHALIAARAAGWHVICSADVSAKYVSEDVVQDVDTLYLAHWPEGPPEFAHRVIPSEKCTIECEEDAICDKVNTQMDGEDAICDKVQMDGEDVICDKVQMDGEDVICDNVQMDGEEGLILPVEKGELPVVQKGERHKKLHTG